MSETSGSSLSSMFGNRTVMSGLATGLDTQALVKAATANLKASINTKKQKLQTLQWKQDAYRDVITKLSEFQDKYLNILSPTSIRANAVMNKYSAVSTDDKVQVSASSSATPAEYNITYSKKATKAEIKGTKITDGSIDLDFSDAKDDTNTVSVTLDGSTRSVTFAGGSDVKQNFLDALNKEFENVTSAKFAFREGGDNKRGSLVLDTEEGDVVSHSFKVAYDDSVGIKNDAYSNISKSASIGDIGFTTDLIGDEFKFSVNGVDFSFTRNSSISNIINTVNKSEAGVTLSFSSLSQSFTIASNGTGAGQEINIKQQKGNLINALFNTQSGVGGAVNEGNSVSKPFVNRTVNPDVTLKSSEQTLTGYESGTKMTLTVDGKDVRLDLSDLKKQQETTKIKVKDENGVEKEYNAKVSQTEDGVKLYTYTTSDENGKTTHYASAGIGTEIKDVYTIVEEKDGTTIGYRNGTTYSGDKLDDVAKGTDFENASPKFKEYTAEEYKTALNDAFKAAARISDVDENAVKFDVTDDKRITLTTEAPVKINNASSFGFDTEMNYEESLKGMDEKISDTPLTFKDGNGHTVSIGSRDGGVTLNELLAMKDAGGNNYFSYNPLDGTVAVLDGKSLSGSDENTIDFLNETFGLSLSARGTNARITIDGVTLENADSTFNIDGTSINMSKVDDFDVNDPDSDAEAITITTSKDNSAIKETIKSFINDYNTLIKDLYTQVKTARPKDGKSYYDPLTEEQEDDMEEDEIEKWNEKAKEGWLYNDASVNKLINKIRSAVSTSFNGMSLYDLGIKLKPYGLTDPTYEIDDAKLESAISRWGDDITKFFTDSEKGLAANLNRAIDDAISTKSTDGAGHKKSYGYLTMVAGVKDTVSATKNQLFTQMNSIQSYIDKLQERYEKQQESLWSRFTQLEKYVSNMNAQMSYFSQF